MEQPLHVIWTHNGKVLHGIDLADGQWKDTAFNFGVGFPDKWTEPKEILLTTSGARRRSYDILTNVTLRMVADPDTQDLFNSWAVSNNGIYISMNGGAVYNLLVPAGLTLLASAIGLDAVDGQLGPFDTARLLVRAKVPGNFTEYGKLQFRLAVDCDVI